MLFLQGVQTSQKWVLFLQGVWTSQKWVQFLQGALTSDFHPVSHAGIDMSQYCVLSYQQKHYLQSEG